MESNHKFCPYCGHQVSKKAYHDRHVEACAELPSAAELMKQLDDDLTQNVGSIARGLGVGNKRVRDIILQAKDKRWTYEALNERGRQGRAAGATRERIQKRRTRNRKPCKTCGLLLDDHEEELCKFCTMSAVGLRRYSDVLAMSDKDARWALVRQRDLHTGRGHGEAP